MTGSITEKIRSLYEKSLNERQPDLLTGLISDDYRNASGTGIHAFRRGIDDLLKAFPDIQWAIEDLVADNEKVMVKQKMKGTHQGTFQGINATGRPFISEGFAIYRFSEGKIVSHQVLTDRLSFLKQIGVVPENFPG